MTVRFELRRDTSSVWASVNPILLSGEPGLETDTNKLKFGDGVNSWNALAYFAGNNANANGPFAPINFPGASAASRYVGATISGAPTTGTFLAGDFVIDHTAKIWICTIAGTPGAWSQIGGSSNATLATLPDYPSTSDARYARSSQAVQIGGDISGTATVPLVAGKQARWNPRIVATASGAFTYTLVAYDQLEVDCTLSSATVNPPGSPVVGDELNIKKMDVSTNTITFTGTVDGTTNPSIAYQYGSLLLRWDGLKWVRPDRHTIKSMVDYTALSDPASNVAGLRTLGTGANQAAQGSTSVQIVAAMGTDAAILGAAEAYAAPVTDPRFNSRVVAGDAAGGGTVDAGALIMAAYNAMSSGTLLVRGGNQRITTPLTFDSTKPVRVESVDGTTVLKLDPGIIGVAWDSLALPSYECRWDKRIKIDGQQTGDVNGPTSNTGRPGCGSKTPPTPTSTCGSTTAPSASSCTRRRSPAGQPRCGWKSR